MPEATVLLVEGKNAGDNSLGRYLTREDFTVRIANTGSEAVAWAAENQPDVVIFDASSMRSSGVRSCRRLRSVLPETPIIHSRAASQREERSAEADVYLSQPFTSRKLLNRIRALLPADHLEEEIVRAGDLTLYLTKRSIEVVGRGERRLTPKLACLMEKFLRHTNEVLPRKQLMQEVWNTNYFGDTRTLDVHVRWIREIIEVNPARPKYLKTVRGVGYIFSIPQKEKQP
jgi:DNA-binding response OmpR family regulator